MAGSRRYRVTGVVCMALLAIMLGSSAGSSVQAEDLAAFKQRLADAVAAGELSTDQAALVMSALTKSAGQKPAMKVAKPELAQPQKLSAVDKPAVKLATPKPVAPDLSEEKLRYGALLSELKRAFDAGEITEAQAKEKAEIAHRELFGEESKPAGEKKPGAAGAKPGAPDLSAKTERYEALLAEVKRAVEAGEITEAQAKEKVAYARRELFGEESKSAGEKKPVGDKQSKPVKKPAVQKQADKVSDTGEKNTAHEQAMNELKRAVAAGEITPEQAKEKMAAMRGQVAEAKKRPTNKAPVDKGGAAGISAEQRQARYEEIKRQLGEAVSAGKITQEQAEQKLLDLREKISAAQ